MIQKFVFFFFVGFSLQFLMLSADVSAIEKALTIAALPFSLAAIVLGGVAIRNEIRWMLGVYYIVLSGATVYFVYKLIRLYNNDSISSAVKSLTFFSVLTIMSLFATGVAAGICYMEFGRGLLNASGGVNESIWLTMIRDGLSRNKKDTEKGEEGLAGGRDYTKEEFSSQSGQGDYSNGTTGQMVESNLMSDRRAPNFQVQSAHGRAQSKGSMGHQNSAVRNNRMSLD
ncbi:hypothetical protein BY996DRAFT_6412501 [Phakopsora pachyrhizi]|nr:hypothetical protein BY996DRAFT_6412501 [Phakopsora pachyrhizi]